MLNLSETKKRVDYGRVEDGTYPARIVRIIDFGMQYATDWKTGEVKKYEDGNDVVQHRVWIDFEFPTETIEIDGEVIVKSVIPAAVLKQLEKEASDRQFMVYRRQHSPNSPSNAPSAHVCQLALSPQRQVAQPMD